MQTLTLKKLPPDQACTYAHWLFSQPNDNPPLHDHTFFELFWVTEGVGRHIINGESRRVESGDLVLIRPRDAHGFTSIAGQSSLRFVNVAFHSALWSALKRRPRWAGGGLTRSRTVRASIGWTRCDWSDCATSPRTWTPASATR